MMVCLHRISSEEGVSYESALEKLAAYAKEIKHAITKENRFVPNIGLLYIKDNAYHFKSSGNNFLISSFGFSFRCHSCQQSNLNIEESSETPVIDLKEHQKKAKESLNGGCCNFNSNRILFSLDTNESNLFKKNGVSLF